MSPSVVRVFWILVAVISLAGLDGVVADGGGMRGRLSPGRSRQHITMDVQNLRLGNALQHAIPLLGENVIVIRPLSVAEPTISFTLKHPTSPKQARAGFWGAVEATGWGVEEGARFIVVTAPGVERRPLSEVLCPEDEPGFVEEVQIDLDQTALEEVVAFAVPRFELSASARSSQYSGFAVTAMTPIPLDRAGQCLFFEAIFERAGLDLVRSGAGRKVVKR